MLEGFCASVRLAVYWRPGLLDLTRSRARLCRLSRRASSSSVYAASAVNPMGLWHALPGTTKEELSLEFTLPTGQSFRWRSLEAAEPTYDGVVGQRAFRLVQNAAGVRFCVLARGPDAQETGDAAALADYFFLSRQLAPLTKEWAERDKRFRSLAACFPGARVLRQDPVECLFSFICSSNNHIARIAGMVERFCSTYGTPLPTATPDVAAPFHAFPTLEQLTDATEEDLRAAGFGYRARFVVQTAAQLRAQPGGGAAWLHGLRDVPYSEAAEALCALPGVGPKVAACICLFSLDKAAAVPVDTHVWQLATQHYLPHLRGKKPSKALNRVVEEALQERFGSHAGWAHNVLFISELAQMRHLLPGAASAQLVVAEATAEACAGPAQSAAELTDLEAPAPLSGRAGPATCSASAEVLVSVSCAGRATEGRDPTAVKGAEKLSIVKVEAGMAAPAVDEAVRHVRSWRRRRLQ